jgi:deoxyribose-phosphate aldolase
MQFYRSKLFAPLCFVGGVAVGAWGVKNYSKKQCCFKTTTIATNHNNHNNNGLSLTSSVTPVKLPAENAAIAGMIDHTVLKQTCSESDIVKLCREAIQYGFASVCVPPYWAIYAKQLLAGSPVKVAIVVGFPFGYSDISAKVAETRKAVVDEVDEIDIVANICAIKSKDWDCLREEIRAIKEAACGRPSMKTKVIIESGVLTDEEILKCCEIYGAAGIDYLKTSTGYADKGASVHSVKLFRANLPEKVQIKASGGIRTRSDAQAMISAGATRLGCSAGVSIVTEGSNTQPSNSDPKSY